MVPTQVGQKCARADGNTSVTRGFGFYFAGQTRNPVCTSRAALLPDPVKNPGGSGDTGCERNQLAPLLVSHVSVPNRVWTTSPNKAACERSGQLGDCQYIFKLCFFVPLFMIGV